MKNIHIIPTDKPSRLFKANQKLVFDNTNDPIKCISAQHIYITSDEEIKEGVDQWYLDKVLNEPYNSGSAQYSSKQDIIILTTDQDLIADGVQAIDDEFLEWFVKNPSCEEVEVNLIQTEPLKGFIYNFEYKIIIPKEEQKELRRKLFTLIKSIEQEEPKQETHICKYCKAETTQSDDGCYAKPKQDPLEEAAKEYAEMHLDVSSTLGKYLVKAVFLDGAQCQSKRMYSEEDIINALHSIELRYNRDFTIIYKGMKEWFEQFKKK